MTRSKIAVSAVTELQKQLRELPERKATEVSMVQAIRLLAPGIRGMQAKGYTMAEIAEALTSKGIPIAAVTLKSYLSRFVGAPRVKPIPKERRSGTVSRAPSGSSTERSSQSPSSAAPELSGPTTAGAKAAPAGEGVPIAGPMKVSPTEPSTRPASPSGG